MNGYGFSFANAELDALNTGALWWRDESLLCVSDLHLGKSERIARKGGSFLPPYETQDTLNRLAADIERTGARVIVCLGDSFDDLGSALELSEEARLQISQMQAGRQWIWIEGNHDPGPTELGGSHLVELTRRCVTFRHIAQSGAQSEISGHYHPKASVATRGRRVTRSAFLVDRERIVMPAYGTYTGGLDCRTPVLRELMLPDAIAVLTGPQCIAIPMPI